MTPPSATDLRINLVGLAGMLATAGALIGTPLNPNWLMVLMMAAAALPILALDLLVHRVYRRPTTGLDWTRTEPRDPSRIATKWFGATAAIAMVGAVYALTPEYQGDFYQHFYWLVRAFGPIAAVIGLGYLAWLDRYLVEPKDAYWHFGAWLTGRRTEADPEKVADLLRGWVIKGFFVPLMYTYAVRNVIDLRLALGKDEPDLFVWAFDTLWSLGFLVDIVFTTMGYLLTLRLFDTHLRSAEPTVTGWVVALVCYQPFFGLISRQYLAYDNGYSWGQWLAGVPALKIVWGVVLLLLLAMFSGSTVAFGCRFSNLTHRGIITGGFYRWMRHPAYFSKCTSYWLLFVPFVSNGSGYEVVRDCTMLSMLCVVYWLRARTEERHLSRDPAYVRYALWMNDHSVWAPLGRWFPILAYRPPTVSPPNPTT